MKSTARIIDANTNRAREALRVLEEAARFLVDHTEIAGELKHMRHELCRTLANTPGLIHHRDTPGDVGTEITTPTEQHRARVHDVVAAAGARLSEALRVIEEYGKTNTGDSSTAHLAATAERLRYRGYDLTQRLLRAMGTGPRTQWRLCLLLTESLCTHHDWRQVLERSVSAGADAVQVREKAMDGGALLQRVQQVLTIVDKRSAVIVNDRPDIASLAGADGVHLGQTDLNPIDVRRLTGDALSIGVSTSSLDQAEQALADGADYCGVGPVFATTTKHKPTLAGPDYLRAYTAWGKLPHLAVGGITPDNLTPLIEAGCQGVAASSAICSAKDPAAVTRAILDALPASTQANG